MRSLGLTLLLAAGLLHAQTAQQYHRQAAQLLEQHELKEAERLLRRALRRFPDHPPLLLQLGALLTGTGRLAGGEALLDRVLELEPQNREALRTRGEAHLQRGEIPAAIELFERSSGGRTQDAASAHNLAFALLAQGRDDRALEESSRAVEAAPLNPRFRKLYALLLEIAGRPEEAYRQLKFAYHLAPRDPGLLFQLAQKRRLAGALLQALEYLELAVEQDPENPVYHDHLAELYRRLDQEADAERHARLTAGLRGAFEVYLEALSLSTRGKKQEAISLLEPVVRAQNDFVSGMMLLADLFQWAGRQQEALDLYLEVLRRSPFHAAAREKSAWIQVRQGFLDGALKLLREARPASPNYALIAGYHAMLEERWQDALAHFRVFEEKNPLHAGVIQLISHCLSALGDREEALAHLKRAENLHPGDPSVRRQTLDTKLERTHALFRQRRWHEALRGFRELLREDEIRSDYLFWIAYCRQQLGDLEQAVSSYRAGLEMDPGADWARINLASCLYRLQRYGEAAPEWETLAARTATADALFNLGLCYSHLDRYPEAERMFERALEQGDRRPELFYNLGAARMHNLKPEEGWPLIERAARAGYGPARELVKRRQRH